MFRRFCRVDGLPAAARKVLFGFGVTGPARPRLAMIGAMETPLAPKVFVSHASEDKARFVNGFAERLRANGVDAWLDQWEMKPGDSLVDRIFEQGLKSAQAVIIVLSAVSVTKPWVREELNNSVVSRINRGLRIIPVVIDQCAIPEALAATLWQRVDDLEHYDEAFQRILDAIF